MGDVEVRDAWREGQGRHVVRQVTRPSMRKYIPTGLRKRAGFVDFAFEDRLQYNEVMHE